MSKVAILGAGPAGLMAAYACERNGLSPVIFSDRLEPSQVNEDMYLQRPLPDVPGHDSEQPDTTIEYIQQGTSRGYASKCYGDPLAPVSWEQIGWGVGNAWWLKDVYLKLHEHFLGSIVEHKINYLSLEVVRKNHLLTISTLPAPVLCGGGHTFESRATKLVRFFSEHAAHPRVRNEMVYNGCRHPEWFRYSRLRGWVTYEYAGATKFEESINFPAPIDGQKFIGNNCTCNPFVHRVGRWSQWKRGVLNHHAYEQATAILASEGLGKGA